jgi:ABC-type lipoprotein export system ATPase subunit
VLALLAKEPSHGYQLRARLRQALGPLGDQMNAGQVYVTLTRLEKAGLVASEPSAGRPDRPDPMVYELTPDAGLVRAVVEVDLDVAAGETVAIMGPSGCGKSTLLHLLGGLDRPSGGEVRLAGSRVDRMSERALARLRQDAVGFVFQAFHLMDELTAVENVELPALLAGRPARVARRRATELIERVGLAERAGFLPAALSGGQRQRVAIARALANEPLVVLADEPTGNLDSAATLEVLRLFESLHAAGQTLVVVTHDSRIAATADRMISMRDGTFIDETRLTGGTRGDLGTLAGLEGLS